MSPPVFAEVKELFLDRGKVLRRVSAAKRRAMIRVGGAVRLTARRSIRKRKSISKPGSPPSSHTGRLRRGIFFSYQPREESVIVGPVAYGDGTQPSILERGGSVFVRNQLIAIDGGVRRGEGGRFVSGKTFTRFTGTAIYRARPYMGPALETNRARLPEAFAEAMKRSKR